MNIYYVYAYLRPDSTPYYIGKGKGYRAWAKDHKCPVPKDRNRIIILEKSLTNQAALDLETDLIKYYGRRDLGTGILLNKTDGGASPVLYGSQNGMTGKSHTEDTREKIRASKLGKPRLNTKRVTCSICAREYSPQGFIRHCRQHPDSDLLNSVYKYTCDHCGKNYVTGSALRAHIKKIHPGMSTDCVRRIDKHRLDQ